MFTQNSRWSVKDIIAYPVGKINGENIYAAVDKDGEIYIGRSAIAKILYGSCTGTHIHTTCKNINIELDNIKMFNPSGRGNCSKRRTFIRYADALKFLNETTFVKRNTQTKAEKLASYLETSVYPRIQILIKQGMWARNATMNLNFKDDVSNDELKITQSKQTASDVQGEPTANNTEHIETIRAIVQSEIANAAYSKCAIEQLESKKVDLSKYVSREIVENNLNLLLKLRNKDFDDLLECSNIDDKARIIFAKVLKSDLDNIRIVLNSTLANEKIEEKNDSAAD